MGIRRWLRELTASRNTLEVLNLVRDAPGSSIRDLEDGVVARVIGVVEPIDDRRVRAPISDRRVLGWGWKVQSLDVQGERRELLPFAIADGGDRAMIDADHARLLIAATEFAKCRGVGGAPDHLFRLLDELGAADPEPHHQSAVWQGSSIPRTPSTYRFSEWVIEPGMVLAVVGSGVREPDPRAMPADYRGDRLTWIRIAGAAELPLAITDELDP